MIKINTVENNKYVKFNKITNEIKMLQKERDNII